ncbi:MAG: GNAT family N-acetyltransferase [Bacteroidota bacterium]
MKKNKVPFVLRPWSMSDLESLIEQANNFNIADLVDDHFPHPYTLDAGREFIELAMAATPRRILAIDVEGKAVGAIGIHPGEGIMWRNAELGYWLGEIYWGHGIMTAAVKEIVNYGFEQWPGIDRIFARPFGSNHASQRVLEKAGFVFEHRFLGTIDKNGRREDELYYAIRRKQTAHSQ